MTDIAILDSQFAVAPVLCDLLLRRRVAAQCVAALPEAQGAAMLICSARTEAGMGGRAKLIEALRRTGIRRLAVIDEAAPAFSAVEEMGGRILCAGLPAAGPEDTAADPLSDGALMLLLDTIAAPFAPMVAADPATGALIDMATRVARFDVNVFVNGPTGSGKEVLARLIHARSPRAENPFVAVNSAAIPENMLEAILFGHEKGAFTGAAAANKGIMRAADGGTLLLDEISEMPLGLQAKLLRVLQEKAVTPLGSQKETPVDIRVIATSNRDMGAEIAAGRFREDLYYRLNVFPLETMPLAARKQDLPALAAAMLRRHARGDGPVPVLLRDACARLMAHDWPGNVRELENVVQRALVLQEGAHITADDIMITATSGLSPLIAA